MNACVKFLGVATGIWLIVTTNIRAQSDAPASTNAPTLRTPPPLPPLPPPLAGAAAAHRAVPQSTVFRAVTNSEGKQTFIRTTNYPVQPIRRPPYSVVPAPARTIAPAPQNKPFPLLVDADVKEYFAKPGETNAHFTFALTNNSPSEVTVNEVRTSCGCTVAKLPSQPWVLVPGTNGDVHVTVDLRGKHGLVTKLIYVYGDFATKTLTVKVNIPEAPALAMSDRARNLQLATADRQAVFKNDCARCHAAPTLGKQGAELFAAACGVCHESEHRASMVPDLRHLNHSTDRIYWKIWISQGKEGSLMPAFAQAHGGPLSEAQINSLVDYLAENIPARPAATSLAPARKLPASQ